SRKAPASSIAANRAAPFVVEDRLVPFGQPPEWQAEQPPELRDGQCRPADGAEELAKLVAVPPENESGLLQDDGWNNPDAGTAAPLDCLGSGLVECGARSITHGLVSEPVRAFLKNAPAEQCSRDPKRED